MLEALLLTGYIQTDPKQEFLNSLNGCDRTTMQCILDSSPKYWAIRFKRAQQRDYIPMYGGSLYLRDVKPLKKKAKEYGIDVDSIPY